MTNLTAKQKSWDETKAAQRQERRRPMLPNVLVGLAADTPRTGSFYRDPRKGRGVRTPVMPRSRPRGQCTECPHGWKHHSKSGNCRLRCACSQGSHR
ncbi:hypothetical protein [Mycobacterium sp. SMC-4]|uniref:hypothetical protein n=1 Tax=Mycobacterium sp. SMC-4 TaxID=2857059 RepID=UPI0021B1B671|nr:hypothetical protein [Mycobacterium sp. SMC-4]UXA19506.1 hypothetical protein KXD98_07875 [Mycobacterium sp. SMC-4]